MGEKGALQGSSNNRARPATTTATRPLLLRVPDEVLSAMKREAHQEQSSVNSLLVGIVKRHLSWGRLQQKLGFMPLHRSMVTAMLDRLTAEEMQAIGVAQKDQTIRDFLLFRSGYSLESFIEWIGLRCDMLGFHLALKHEEEEEEEACGTMRGRRAVVVVAIIHHGMGHKWSAYYRGLFSAVLEELLPAGMFGRVGFTATDSLFSVRIPLQQSP
jgi:hypothetical protein